MKHYLELFGSQHGKPPSTKIAASVFKELCYNNKDNLSAGIIVAGYDSKRGGEIYSLPLGGSVHNQEYAIAGSGSAYIYGFCNKNFKPGMTQEETVKFMKTCMCKPVYFILLNYF